MNKKFHLLISIIIFYSLGLLFSCLNAWFFNTHTVAIEYFRAPVFWLGPLFFILFGLGIGGLLLILSKPKNETRLLSYATLTGLIIFCISIESFQFYNWYHRRYLANIEFNKDFLNSNTSYPLQEQQAFKMLTNQYKDPNDLRLSEVSESRYDSIVNKATIEAYEIGFVYFKKNRKGRYRSRCLIIGGNGNLQFFDRSLSDSEERSADSSSNEGLREGLKAILEDSARLSLDSATRETIRGKIKSKKIVSDTLAVPR